MSADSLLLDSTFTITDVDHKKYDRVCRITGSREDFRFILDIHSELYPVSVGETVQLSLASTLSLDGSKDDAANSKTGWRETRSGEMTLADTYDYVCYGKVYRFEEATEESIHVYASFGGLLLHIEGPHKRMLGLKHEYIYLLLKK